MLRLSILLLISNLSFANMAERKAELSKRKAGLVSKSINKRLERAYHYMANNGYPDAIKLLKKTVESAGSNKFAKAKVTQTLAYAYAQSEKHDLARKAFESALKLDALPLQPTLQSMFALAQLKSLNNEKKAALKLMTDYMALTQKLSPEAFVFAATLYHEMGNKNKALEFVEKAINSSAKPKENWLTFAVSLHYEKQNYKKAEKYLKFLAAIAPTKKIYWSQLAGALINQNKETQATTIMSLAYHMGLLDKESEILNISSLYLSTDMPFEASKLLEKALKDKKVKESKKSLEMLATSLASARETKKAMKPLKRAAELADDGKLFAYYASLLLDQEKWQSALSAFQNAIKKGGVKDEGNLLVGQGIALLQLDKKEEAQSMFLKALTHDKVKKQASQWLTFLENKQ